MPRTAAPPITAIPGEDRTFGGNALFVDLVPSSTWYTNVRACVSGSDWKRLRAFVSARVQGRCEVCGEIPARLDCHERWEYDETVQIQRLRRLIALCSHCHAATHFGLTALRGYGQYARDHLAKVNGWSDADVKDHLRAATALWKARSTISWTVDVCMLSDIGITVNPPPRAQTPDVFREFA
jgi:5-methylcytosine-specific restriction endonuclease McrA